MRLGARAARRAWAPALAALLLAATASAGTTIGIRVSVKVILDPLTGQRPLTAQGTPITDSEIESMFTMANDTLFTTYQRGYRFVLTGPPQNIGSPCAICPVGNPSRWFAETFPEANAEGLLHDFEVLALNNATFGWDPTAVNVFINSGKGNGGISSFPFRSSGSNAHHHVVFWGGTLVDDGFATAFPAAIAHHEIGHYFNLFHTHDGQPACVDTLSYLCSACEGAPVAADSVLDTIEDRSCSLTCPGCISGWHTDELALHTYGVPFNQLGPAEAQVVLDTYENNMSYHNHVKPYGRAVNYRMTEGQLDRWADNANNVRHDVVTGRTRFATSCPSCGGNGSSASPFGTVFAAHAAANPGDILLLRPGNYAETLLLTKPVTLRVPRTGTARIGQ